MISSKKGLRYNLLKGFGKMAATNEILEKSLLVFKMFGISSAIIPK